MCAFACAVDQTWWPNELCTPLCQGAPVDLLLQGIVDEVNSENSLLFTGSFSCSDTDIFLEVEVTRATPPVHDRECLSFLCRALAAARKVRQRHNNQARSSSRICDEVNIISCMMNVWLEYTPSKLPVWSKQDSVTLNLPLPTPRPASGGQASANFQTAGLWLCQDKIVVCRSTFEFGGRGLVCPFHSRYSTVWYRTFVDIHDIEIL